MMRKKFTEEKKKIEEKERKEGEVKNFALELLPLEQNEIV